MWNHRGKEEGQEQDISQATPRFSSNWLEVWKVAVINACFCTKAGGWEWSVGKWWPHPPGHDKGLCGVCVVHSSVDLFAWDPLIGTALPGTTLHHITLVGASPPCFWSLSAERARVTSTVATTQRQRLVFTSASLQICKGFGISRQETSRQQFWEQPLLLSHQTY